MPPLAVCAGERLNVPHAPALPHVAVQSTPRPAASLLTAAVRLAAAFSASVAGSADVIVTASCVDAMIVTVADADFVVSETEVAVSVTMPPEGTAVGAV